MTAAPHTTAAYAAIWAANLLGWPILQLSIARLVLFLPARRFAADTALYLPRPFERHGLLYRNTLHIRRWKRLLPDAAPWLRSPASGGFRKTPDGLPPRDPAYLARFLAETRRAELAHWLMLLCLPLFFLWNPLWACAVMTAYALAANLPCILTQRYNRIQLTRLAHLAARRPR